MGIKYSDSEVNVFHPLCEKALTAALQKLNLQKKYRVIHHQYTGSLEMDFCIQNQATKKYLCVIEVKRTPADVHSSRYQFQALSYVQSNEGNQRNKKATNKLGVKGVSITHCNTYQAQIQVDGQLKYLGSYHTIKEAADAYDSAAIKYFGEFAWLNNYDEIT